MRAAVVVVVVFLSILFGSLGYFLFPLIFSKIHTFQTWGVHGTVKPLPLANLALATCAAHAYIALSCQCLSLQSHDGTYYEADLKRENLFRQNS